MRSANLDWIWFGRGLHSLSALACTVFALPLETLWLSGDWRDDDQYEDRSSQMDDITDWRETNRRSTADEVVDKVVDYINKAQPFGSPRASYR